MLNKKKKIFFFKFKWLEKIFFIKNILKFFN